MATTPDISLVFTVALEKEVPIEWISDRGVAIHRIRALRSGALRLRSDRASGVLFAITGVGPAASRDAALWIRDHIRPLFVVNVGTAGALDRSLDLGRWVRPTTVRNEDGREIALDSRLPFPAPPETGESPGRALLSSSRPLLDRTPPGSVGADIVDMEAFSQAEAFHGTGTSFHALKSVSDRAAPDADAEFARHLPQIRRDLQRILEFLTGPGPPDISVVIPVHDRKRQLAACVESVIQSTLPAREVLVVDDASNEPAAEALAPLAPRVRTIRLPEHLGVAAARNRGVREARAPWIALLDSDDSWTPEKLERSWRFLERHPHYRALQTGEVWIRRGVRVNPAKHHEKPHGWIWPRCLERCLVSPSAVLLERDLLTGLGGFDEALPVCEDYDLWIRLGRHHPVGLEPAACVIKHGGHEDQLSRRYRAMDRFRVRALLKALQKEKDEPFRSDLCRALRKKLRILIEGSRKRGRLESASVYGKILEDLPLPDKERQRET